MIRTSVPALAVVALAGCDLVFPPGEFEPAVDATPPPPDCPPTYHLIDGAPSEYRIVVNPMLPWLEAEQTCNADTTGQASHLVVFDDFLELAALREDMEPIGGFLAYVGYGRDTSDPPDRFTAITGEALSPVSNLWEPGEPTGGTEQVLYFSNVEDLIDGPHTIPLPYVCECDGRPPTETFTFP